jgi:23S rRNA pseudouridine2605 synthase
VLARARLASRRDAEEMVTQGRVTVNGRVINSPALDVWRTMSSRSTARTCRRASARLFMYHKPRE